MFRYTAFILIFLSSCKTLELKQNALQAPESYKSKLMKAEKISIKNPNLAIFNLNQLLSTHPENSLSDDALFLLGHLLEKTEDLKSALKAYSRILDSKYLSPLDGRALIQKTNILSKLGNNNEALKALNYTKHHQLIDQQSLQKIKLIKAPLLIQNEKYFDYLHNAKDIILTTKDQALAQRIFRQAQDILKIKLTSEKSKKILNEPFLDIFHPQAALNLITYYFEKKSPQLAISNLKAYFHLLDQPLYKDQRDELIIRSRLYTPPNKDVIGVIIPLSGKYQSVGEQILKGLQYSLNIWDPMNKTKFKLAILNSEGDPNQVPSAFDELIKNDKPIAIVGGLIGKTAQVLLQKSEKYKIPTLILSQKEGLAKSFQYGFQRSQSLEKYTDLISNIAIEKLNIKRVSVLHSKKSFSIRYAKTFSKNFIKKGGQIVQTIEYDLSEKRAIPNAIKSLVGLLTIKGREEEYHVALKSWQKSSRSRGNASPKIEELLKPQVDFDALFIANGAKNSGLIASTLAYFDVENLTLLGTHLWNDNDLLERGQRFVENSIFASSYFAPHILRSKCGQEFLSKFQEPINSYIFKGIEVGVILNTIHSYFEITSRKTLLSALNKTSIITHKCLPQGLIREGYNFSSPLFPLTVKDKGITLMTLMSDKEENK